MLTSPKNPTIQKIRKLQARARARRAAGLFVIEGARLVQECLVNGPRPETVLYTDAAAPALLDAARARDVTPLPVSEAVMRAAADTHTPQGVLAVVPIPDLPLPTELDWVLILDQVRDPGNLGTILRTAAAAGVDAALLAPGGVDPYAPKVLRAGMGAHFRLPLRAASWDEIEAHCAGLNVFLAAADGETEYTQADLTGPLALVIGGEARGAGREVERLNPTGLRIPMPGRMESLNAGAAAAVLVFETRRQRDL